MIAKSLIQLLVASLFYFALLLLTPASFAQNHITYEPAQHDKTTRHIVLIAGDEAYRSEESLPMLARILTTHHGFRTTIFFSVNPESQYVDPNEHVNMTGLHLLNDADLVILATRFREYPDDQMRYFDQYLNSGKPIIGIRTATHAFRYQKNPESRYAKYGFTSKVEGWEGGFGKRILGENWVSHHGANGKEGTRGLINGLAQQNGHPILKGVKDIWGITDVYGIKSLPESAEVLAWGLPVDGLKADSPGVWDKSVMPIAWTTEYVAESGKKGRAFTSTIGASMDLLSEDLRRMLVNACYWAMEMEKDIPEKPKVDIVGDYQPTMFGFDTYQKGKKPTQLK